jgi:hypothetical protein
VILGARSTLTQVAVTVGDALRRHRIRAVLTGGACASLHSGGACHTADVDFVLLEGVTRPRLDQAMAAVGFIRAGERYLNPRLHFYVEFPRGPLAIGGDHHIRPIEHRLDVARTFALSATDACRDRLAAFYHWDDRQALAAAVAIALRNRLRAALLERWSIEEGHGERYQEFRVEVAGARRRARPAR